MSGWDAAAFDRWLTTDPVNQPGYEEGIVSYQKDSIDWQAIEFMDRWLDDNVSDDYKVTHLAQDWARISKVAEEIGEAIQAFIGVTGQNPRKGVSHTMREVLGELADTCVTSILAIEHFTKNPAVTREIIMTKIAASERRIRNLQS